MQSRGRSPQPTLHSWSLLEDTRTLPQSHFTTISPLTIPSHQPNGSALCMCMYLFRLATDTGLLGDQVAASINAICCLNARSGFELYSTDDHRAYSVNVARQADNSIRTEEYPRCIFIEGIDLIAFKGFRTDLLCQDSCHCGGVIPSVLYLIQGWHCYCSTHKDYSISNTCRLHNYYYGA